LFRYASVANLPAVSELWRMTSEGWTENAKVRVSRLAQRQGGRVSRAQLERLRVGSAQIDRWRREFYLQRVLPGVYAVGHRAPSIEGDLAAALLYAGAGAALSHTTALWWLELVPGRSAEIGVSTPERHRSVAGVRVHGRRSFERTWHRGLPVTTVALALRDYAAGAPLDRVRRALAEAEYRRQLDLDAVRRVLGQGLPGSATLRRALEHHEPQLAFTRSVLEERFLALCESAHLPRPECNSTVDGLMVDMLWRAQGVIVELDGHQAHGSRAQIERDRVRDLRLRAAGFVVLRYTWGQITREPELVAADLAAALERGRRLRASA
jgi:very-short-patch-repair endonuclease/predicted transcriptional regulator of viral defense system